MEEGWKILLCDVLLFGKLAIRDRWLSVPLPSGRRVSGRRRQRRVVLFRSFQVVDLALQSVDFAEEWLQIGSVLLAVLLELLLERRLGLASLPSDFLPWSRRRLVDVLVLLVVVAGVLLFLSQVTTSNLLIGQTDVANDDVCPLTSSLVSRHVNGFEQSWEEGIPNWAFFPA